MKEREVTFHSGGKYLKRSQRGAGMLLLLIASSVLVVIGSLIAYAQRSIWVGGGVLVVVFILLSSARYFIKGVET